MGRWWLNSSRKKRQVVGRATECRVYTPNKRCRPEAPLTSLPKLTPVKNVGEDRRDGGGEQQKIKIIKDRSRGKVVKAGTQLIGVY